VPGPASLPYDQAVKQINIYIDTENPLGKGFIPTPMERMTNLLCPRPADFCAG